MDPTVWGIAPHQDRSRPAGPVWAHVPHRVGRLLMPLPRRRMGLSSDEHRALSEAAKAGACFGILSGLYGLLRPDEPIPYYDHLLAEDEVAPMVPRVAEVLAQWEVQAVRWFTVDPALDPNVSRYRRVMEGAAASVGVPFFVEIVTASD